MVLGAFKKYVFGPRREAQREAAEAKRRAEDAEKRAEKRREDLAAWEAWYERRVNAKERGKPFDEPPPSRKE